MDRDAMAQAAYEARHIGHFVTPWDDLPSDRRWFWYAVVDAVLREYVGQLQYTMPRPEKRRARTVRVARRAA